MHDTMTWIDSTGAEYPLNTARTLVRQGTTGRAMPPIDYSDAPVPELAGTRLRQIRHDASEVAVPVVLTAATEASYLAEVRAWARRFDPVRGEGRLRASTGRELPCRYIGGLEQAPEEHQGLLQFVALFRAFEPYWRDASETLVTFGGDNTFFPFFPLAVSPEATLGEAVVDNDGDVDAWPVWTITGPGEAPRFVNDTTGAVLELTNRGGISLAAGETLTIDTRPGVKTVRHGDGTNLYPLLTPASSLWPLRRGSQAITIELLNVAAETRVNLTYRRRYLGA